MNPHQPNQGDGGDEKTAARGRGPRDVLIDDSRASTRTGILANQRHFQGLQQQSPTTNPAAQFLPNLPSLPLYPTTISVPSDVSRSPGRSWRLPVLNTARQQVFRPDHHMTHHSGRRSTFISLRKPLSTPLTFTNNGLKVAPSSGSNPDQLTTNTNRIDRTSSQCRFSTRTISYQIGKRAASIGNAGYSKHKSSSHSHYSSTPGTFVS